MAYEALLTGRVTADPTATDSTLRGRVQGGSPSLSATLEALAGAASQLDPTTGPGITAQVLEIAFSGSRGGYPFELTDHADTQDGIEVDRSLTDKTTWNLRVPASSGRWQEWALGYEVAFGGAPPPGLARINIEARYGRGSGQFSVPLVTGGLATSSGRAASRQGHGISLSGFGPEARWDRKLVTLQLPPNHGLTHGAIVRLAAEDAGIPSELVQIDESIGFPLTRALDAVEEEFWSLATDVLLGCGHVPRFDEDGFLMALPRAPQGSGAPELRIVAGRLLGEEIESLLTEGNADVVTCIRVEGVKPVIPENEADGMTREVTFQATYELGFRPREAWFVNDGGLLDPIVGATGSFEPSGPVFRDFEGRVLKAMVVTVKEKQGGCLMAEDTINFGWYVPEAARYRYENPASPDGVKVGYDDVFIYEASAVDGDAAPAYVASREQWSILSRDRKDYVYGGGDDGHELSTIRHRTGGYLNETNAAKTPGSPAPYDWPSENYIADQWILGGGRVVKNAFESFRGGLYAELRYLRDLLPIVGTNWQEATSPTDLSQPLTDSVMTHTGRGGYLVRTEDSRSAYALETGTGFWFEGDEVHASLFEEFLPVESEVVTNNAAPGDTTFTRVTVRANAITGENIATVEGAEGYLPAIPRCDIEDNARKEGEPFKAELCRGEEYRAELWNTVQSDFVENEIQAGNLADVLLREAQGIPVTVAIPFDATIRPGMTCSLHVPDLHIAHRGWVDGTKLRTNGRFRYSELSLKLHPY